MKLSQLVENRRTVTIPIGSGEITLGYNPAGVTPRMFAMIEEVQQEADNARVVTMTMARMLTQMVTDWDVTDDDGEPLPLTAAAMMDVPIQILSRICEVIFAEIAVPNSPSAPSDSGSSPAGSQDALPSGISSFARVGT
jgi:hypothetical protein